MDDVELTVHTLFSFAVPSFSILNRNFVEFCILCTYNFPRILLMYLTSIPSSLSNYLLIILCNFHQFNRTIISHNLLHIALDKSSKRNDVYSGQVFGSQFQYDDPVLDRIDVEILNRNPGQVVPGGWCLGESGNNTY